MLSTQEKISTASSDVPSFVPIRIMEVELRQPLSNVSTFDEKTGHHYHRALCVVRLHSQPLGIVELELGEEGLSADECARCIWHTLAVQIIDHLQQDGLPVVTELREAGLSCLRTPSCIEERERFMVDAPFVSVIIPTHERPEQLAACLSSLMSLQYPHYEVIVVDNAPETGATADLVEKLSHDAPHFRYVREDLPGPSWARNRGIMVARGTILAFADDDVVVDPYWLVELVRAFSVDNDVACVTGLLLPLELETFAQFLFEEHGGFNRGFTSRIFKRNMGKNSLPMPFHPYAAGRFGTGASMAFTSGFLHSMGGFDPSLGGNGPSRNGQDIAVFFQVIMQGYKLVYQPRALAYHLHRRDYAGLRKQIYNYGIGFTAFLMKSVLENPLLLFDLIAKVPYALFFVLNPQSPKNSKKSQGDQKKLTMLMRKGMLYGPLAYLQSRHKMHRMHKVLARGNSHVVALKGKLVR